MRQLELRRGTCHIASKGQNREANSGIICVPAQTPGPGLGLVLPLEPSQPEPLRMANRGHPLGKAPSAQGFPLFVIPSSFSPLDISPSLYNPRTAAPPLGSPLGCAPEAYISPGEFQIHHLIAVTLGITESLSASVYSSTKWAQ